MSTLSDDLRTLSYEAALYFYPLVIMDVTRLQAINTPAGTKEGFGPPNEFQHFSAFPTADMRAVVRPNFDTLYSMAWLGLTAGPVILHVPDTDGRYYMLPLLDMWTDAFANPGKRTTGTDAQDFVITGPGYAGDLPEGLPVIAAPTPYVWIIGRTQTNGPADYDAVHKVQDGYRISPVGKSMEHAVDSSYDISTEPPKTVNNMSAVDFFTYAAQLLATNPPHATDFSQLARMQTWASWPVGRLTQADSAPTNAPRSTPGSPRRCTTCARRYQRSGPASTAGSRPPKPWVSTAITTSNAPWWHSSGWAPTRPKTPYIHS